MFTHQPSVRGKEKDCAIKRTAITLDDTYDQENPCFSRGFPQSVACKAWNIQGAFIIAPEIIPAFWLAEANPRPKV
jgi:hypothetical protein